MEARNRRILIIEDTVPIAEGLAMLLEAEEYVVHIAPNCGDGMRALSAFEPDLILLDVKLPDCDGRDLYIQIRSERSDVPVIFSSGTVSEQNLAHLLGAGVSYLQKPYDYDRLLAEITLLLKDH